MVRIRKKNLSAHRDSLLISQKKKKSDEDRDVQPILYDEVDVIEEDREENEEDDQQQQMIDPNESAFAVHMRAQRRENVTQKLPVLQDENVLPYSDDQQNVQGSMKKTKKKKRNKLKPKTVQIDATPKVMMVAPKKNVNDKPAHDHAKNQKTVKRKAPIAVVAPSVDQVVVKNVANDNETMTGKGGGRITVREQRKKTKQAAAAIGDELTTIPTMNKRRKRIELLKTDNRVVALIGKAVSASTTNYDIVNDSENCVLLVAKSKQPNAKIDGMHNFPFNKSDDSLINGQVALDWLLSPIDREYFYNKIWQRKAMVFTRKSPVHYCGLFGTNQLTKLLQNHELQYDEHVNIAKYTNGTRLTLNGEGRVFVENVGQYLQDGCSIQLINPQCFDDSIWYLCDILQEVFGCFVGANSYLTPAGSSGFAPHHDDIDAFLLQLEGRKHWRVFAPQTVDNALPRRSSGNLTEEEMSERVAVFDGWLECGDLLYLPRGYVHQAHTDKQHHSHHLTVSFCRNIAYADMYEKLFVDVASNMADRSLEMRASLPIGYLDNGGIVNAELQAKSDQEMANRASLKNRFQTQTKSIMNTVLELHNTAIDIMAVEFMRTALPPVLTNDEKKMSIYDCSTDTALTKYLGGGGAKSMQRVQLHSSVRFIRRHGQRLIFQTETQCYLAHRMNNSRFYEGRPPKSINIAEEMSDAVIHLVNAYPEWCKVSDLPCVDDEQRVQLANQLYSGGLLLCR